MTREELKEYVEEQRNQDIIPYYVYSALIDGIDTLEEESMSARKKGKPIYDIDSEDWEFNRPFKCPFCNERLDYDIHFCPNCGAEMESEE